MQKLSKATKLALKNFGFFDSLRAEELQKLVAESRILDCTKGETLVTQGDLLSQIYFILSGSLIGKRLSELNPGAEAVLTPFKFGDVIGQEILFSNVPYPISIIASSNSTLLVIKRETLAEVAHNNSQLMVALMKRMATQLAAHETNIYKLIESSFDTKH